MSNRRWKYINEVIVTAGPVQPKIKPGVAIAIIRDCLAALAALPDDAVPGPDKRGVNAVCPVTLHPGGHRGVRDSHRLGCRGTT